MTARLALLLAACAPGRSEPDPGRPPVPSTPGTTEDTAHPTTGETGTLPTGTADETADTGATPTAPPRLFAYVGTDDDRIHVYTVDPVTGALAETSAVDAGAAPTFLAFAPDLRHLYAVNEGSDELAAFSIDGATGALTLLDRTPSRGDGPAHVAVDATGQVVLAANYGGGNVTLVRIEPDGSLGATLETLDTGPNAHMAAVDPSNRFVFVPNLGDDTVSQLVLDPAAGTLVPNAVLEVSLPEGAGPRHIAFHPAAPFAYVIGELGDTLTAMAFDAATGRLSAIETRPTLPAGFDPDDNDAAEIALDPSGRFLYGTNRGHDSLVIYAVDPTSGGLALVGHESTGGSWPRHFSISPDGTLLLVANQRSDTVVAFRIDPTVGTLSPLSTTAVPSGPAFVGIVDLPP